MGNKNGKLLQKEKELQNIEKQLYEKYDKIEKMVNDLETKSEQLMQHELEFKNKCLMNKHHNNIPRCPVSVDSSDNHIEADFARSIKEIRKMNTELKSQRRISIS